MPVQAFQQFSDIALAITKDNAIGHVFFLEQITQGFALFHRRDFNQLLRNIVIGRRCPRHFNALRGREKLLRQAGDFRRHGGREKQRLAGERYHADNLLNIGNKAHIEHAVSFVNHQYFHTAQQNTTALNMVDQTTGCCNQHICAAHNGLLLVFKAHAANQQRFGQLGIFAVKVEIFSHLSRQFAGRLQNQCARHTRFGAALHQAMYHRQSEAGGFAGAGLRNAQHIFIGNHLGNGLGLNGCRFGIADFVNGLHDFGGQPEFVKRHIVFPCLAFHTTALPVKCD